MESRPPNDLVSPQATMPENGPVSLFVRVVRNEKRGRAVVRLEDEAYDEMALPRMQQIVAETHRRLPVTEVRLAHRLGSLGIGEASVAVAVASLHRSEALAACRFGIDTLETQMPIWRKEPCADGSAWLDEPTDRFD